MRYTEAWRYLHFFPMVAVAILLCFVLACAGNGQGLDENGNPIGNGNGGLPIDFEPTFTNVQQNVFDFICVECHSGIEAPEGLRLTADRSYDLLVSVPSQQQPDLLRVNPGNPDQSYIIRKLEGGPNITGGQMPLDRTPLDQRTINAIRVWIAQGAPRN